MSADPPKCKGFGFSPFHPAGVGHSNKTRVGVPGHKLYPQSWRIFLLWGGSSFQAVFGTPLFYVHMCLLAISVGVFSAVDYTEALQGAEVPAGFRGTTQGLTIFMLTFFIGQNFSEANARFENVCKTNGNVTRLSALAGGLFPPEKARILMRYTNAIMHIYYFLLTGPLNDSKWDVLKQRGLLTDKEIAALQLQGSPAVVLYSRAVRLLRAGPESGGTISMAERTFVEFVQPMEAQIGATRGLAAKQIAYSLYQVPVIYFHIVYFAVNVFMMCTVYETGHLVAKAMHYPCQGVWSAPNPVDGTCPTGCAMAILSEIFLLIIFTGLLMTAEGLSDIYGNKAFHYDLGVDLDNLWQESQNVLASMEIEWPSGPDEKEKGVASFERC